MDALMTTDTILLPWDRNREGPLSSGKHVYG